VRRCLGRMHFSREQSLCSFRHLRASLKKVLARVAKALFRVLPLQEAEGEGMGPAPGNGSSRE